MWTTLFAHHAQDDKNQFVMQNRKGLVLVQKNFENPVQVSNLGKTDEANI